MSMVMVHFTPTSLDMLNAYSLHSRSTICKARLKLRLDCSAFGDCWDCRISHLSCTESYERIVGLSSSRKENRGLHRTVALPRSFAVVEEFESRLGNYPGGGKFRSCCVGAEAVNPPNELQTAEDLREQLESLQQEAEQVRGKANSARLRFMRLTHVVEQLRQRAAMDVRMGKEDSARGLLLEKQKVMKALEAARQRAELLEQLAGKLNVAISMKETLLISALSSAPLSIRSKGADDTAVHHVSPRTEGLNEEMTQSGVDEDDISSRAGLNSD